MSNLVEGLRECAAAHPDRAALITADDHRISYATLDRLIDRAARHLSAAGIRPGHLVGLSVAGPDEAMALVFHLALARLGVASAERGASTITFDFVLLQPADTDRPTQPFLRMGFEALEPVPDEDTLPPVESPPGDKVFRIFTTSGTTGRPHLVAVTHAQMLTRISTYWTAPRRGDAAEVQICAIGLGGSFGTVTVLKLLLGGGTLVFSNPRSLAATVLRHKVTSIVTATNVLQSLMKTLPIAQPATGLGPLPGLGVVLVGGSQMPQALARQVRARLCDRIETSYGATETGQLAFGRLDQLSDAPFAVGRLGPRADVQALDEAGKVLPPGEFGELRMRSPGMAQRYEDEPEISTAQFRDGWFHPGDLGCVMADGLLCISGRVGDVINSGGVKVSPRLIEEVLLARPDITQAAAFGVPDRDGVEQIWVAIVAHAPIPDAELSRLLGERLGPQAPKFVLQMQDLPRTENGKIAFRALVEIGMRHYAEGTARLR